VKVPTEIARERQLPLRWIGGEAYAEMTRADAAAWMQNPVWADLDPGLAELAGAHDVLHHPNYVTVMVPDGAGTLIGADGKEYRTEVKNGRAVERLPSHIARQLLNGGLPCCEAWHRENQFLAARLGAPPKIQPGISISASAYTEPQQTTTDMLTAMRGSIHDTFNMRESR
jgi:hypothetical protein